MKQLTSMKAIIAYAATVLITAACHHEKTDVNSPAYKILQSERLGIPAEISLPANLPKGNSRVATYYAEGVQKYKAQVKAGSSPAEYEWIFVAPQADLYDARNHKVGSHGAGPHWQLSAADSIFAQPYSPPKAATSNGSIDWLLLMPKSGKNPTGVFTGTTYIQRIATTGGKAPSVPPLHVTETMDVKYTAVYRFSRSNP
ncbi:MAG: DUF3455 domain-containing protein [Williamsia sp.]|nr:DUF3455 domain-containing protein [Williamsia sp.]